MSDETKSLFPSTPDGTAHDEKYSNTNVDGLFISRRMRREAEARAEAEQDANELAEETAADVADLHAYTTDPKNAAKSDTEKAYDKERAQVIADNDARTKFGLETSTEAADKVAAAKKAADEATAAKAKADAEAAAAKAK